MSTPKHRTAAGSSYFVTAKCWQGRCVFQVPENAQILIECMLRYRAQSSYQLHEFVVMPNHLHVLVTPAANASLEKAVQLIKGGSSYAIHQRRGYRVQIWQEGFHDWTVRDAEDWEAKVGYIRLNPVRAKLVSEPGQWPYSSASTPMTLDPVPARYVRLTSGAKAPCIAEPVTRGLKPPPPESVANVRAVPGLKSPAAENQGTLASGGKAPCIVARGDQSSRLLKTSQTSRPRRG